MATISGLIRGHSVRSTVTPEDSNVNQQGIDQSEVEFIDRPLGLGERAAKEGDKVRIKFQQLSNTGKVEVEKGPLELILGENKCGQGIDQGIIGMKYEGSRELKIPPDLCPPSKCRLLKKSLAWAPRIKRDFVCTF
ncbi:FK506-binding protein 4-like [Prosopis cineraria]|uniref:FK506-binding protein 4-like n=1 Tax=Prosopis cineraria TaxID=364024 RepID=UPI00240FDDC9|nr:FK506-binding protein 4-like [Prosopis cineraria]